MYGNDDFIILCFVYSVVIQLMVKQRCMGMWENIYTITAYINFSSVILL